MGQAEYKETLLQSIEAAAKRPQHWTAAVWILERKYPEEFGKAERARGEGRRRAAHHAGC